MFFNTRWAMYLSERSAENVLGFHLEEQMMEEDIRRYRTILEGTVTQYDRVKLLIAFDYFNEIDPGNVWEDLKISSEFKNSVERIALVGDEIVSQWVSEIEKMPGEPEIKYFRRGQYDQAWEWIGQD
jgi:hypothetical protein